MKELNFYNMFYIFIISSICGWILENSFVFLLSGRLSNPSAVVIGPFDMAYGIGACFITALLIKFKNSSYLKLFLVGFIGGSILEYIMSLGMELVLGFTAWDYSNMFLNINGRICLIFSIFWGILGIVWIKVCYPFMMKIINKININFKKIFAWCLLVFLIFDVLITISAVVRARNFEKGIPAQNSYEKFLDNTFNVEYLKNMYSNNWE